MTRKPSRSQFAKKSFGQNFLVDQQYIRRIIDAVGPVAGQTVVEIGPGRGALTEHLIESGANVTAIELERDMIAFLKVNFGERENFRLIEGDVLRVDLAGEVGQTPVKLVANLPYYISTAILQRLIDDRHLFESMVLMFQKEVVDRITAAPGDPDRGFLSVMTENYLRAEKLFEVPPRAFRPSPKVTSAIVRLTGIDEARRNDFDAAVFRRIVSAAFAQRRKNILNNFKAAPPDVRALYGDAASFLERSGIDARRRAETLTLNEWRHLAALCSV